MTEQGDDPMRADKEQFTFFWHGPFSQWHGCRFKIDGVVYNCTEQYMMAQKAVLFKDDDALAKIMAATSPRIQKGLGRKVRGFNQSKWDACAREIVYRGNWAKFTQNDDLRQMLLATAGTTVVEASPSDTIWGIGLGEDDPRAADRKTWRGKNWLGEALTRVRDDILKVAEGGRGG
jgi:ribA/ribD-fused uncharacterized protein